MTKITETIEFTEKELHSLFVAGLPGVEIADADQFTRIMRSKKFAQNLAYDVKESYKQIWHDSPEWEVLENLGLTVALEDTTQYS